MLDISRQKPLPSTLNGKQSPCDRVPFHRQPVQLTFLTLHPALLTAHVKGLMLSNANLTSNIVQLPWKQASIDLGLPANAKSTHIQLHETATSCPYPPPLSSAPYFLSS
jgi:hypothetical protein